VLILCCIVKRAKLHNHKRIYNYISCGWKVKSEIVIPIFVNGENIGQIDIDSHTANTFSSKDEELLEYICEKLSVIL
jgi:GAF domain-containing protein